jgi:hypothetical protein
MDEILQDYNRLLATVEKQTANCKDDIQNLENEALKTFLADSLKDAMQNKLDLTRFLETLNETVWD